MLDELPLAFLAWECNGCAVLQSIGRIRAFGTTWLIASKFGSHFEDTWFGLAPA